MWLNPLQKHLMEKSMMRIITLMTLWVCHFTCLLYLDHKCKFGNIKCCPLYLAFDNLTHHSSTNKDWWCPTTIVSIGITYVSFHNMITRSTKVKKIYWARYYSIVSCHVLQKKGMLRWNMIFNFLEEKEWHGFHPQNTTWHKKSLIVITNGSKTMDDKITRP
jgi:hypothetical protein